MKARELGPEHVGQRFIFKGDPEVNAVFAGILRNEGRESQISFSLTNCTTHISDLWESGYWIGRDEEVIPVSDEEVIPVSDEEVIPVSKDPRRDKLAEYIMGRARAENKYFNSVESLLLADIFLELIDGKEDEHGND